MKYPKIQFWHLDKPQISNIIDRLQPSETVVLFGTAITAGDGTGLGAVFFIWLIAQVQTFLYQTVGSALSFLGRGLFILIPTIGGLFVGPIIANFTLEAKGHGVPEVMQAIALRGGRDFLIPHGDKLLLAGDLITLLCKRESCDEATNALVEIKIIPQQMFHD